MFVLYAGCLFISPFACSLEYMGCLPVLYGVAFLCGWQRALKFFFPVNFFFLHHLYMCVLICTLVCNALIRIGCYGIRNHR